jgi:hypothetical protein
MLVAAGADLSAKNREGKTPWELVHRPDVEPMIFTLLNGSKDDL